MDEKFHKNFNGKFQGTFDRKFDWNFDGKFNWNLDQGSTGSSTRTLMRKGEYEEGR